MYCIKGKMWQSSGKWRGSRFKHSLRAAWICVRVACWSGHLYQNVVSFIIHISIYLLHGLFMYLFLPSLDTTVLFWFLIPIWQPFDPWKYNNESQQAYFWYFILKYNSRKATISQKIIPLLLIGVALTMKDCSYLICFMNIIFRHF